MPLHRRALKIELGPKLWDELDAAIERAQGE